MYLIDPNAGQTIRLFKEKRILAGLANLPTNDQRLNTVEETGKLGPS